MGGNYKLQDAAETDKWKEFDIEGTLGSTFQPNHRVDNAVIFPYHPETEFVLSEVQPPKERGRRSIQSRLVL